MKFNKIAASALLAASASLLHSGSASAIFTPYTLGTQLALNDTTWTNGVTITNGADVLTYQLQSYTGLNANDVVDISTSGGFYNLNIDHGPNNSITTTSPGTGTSTWSITANKQFDKAKISALYNFDPSAPNTIMNSTYTPGGINVNLLSNNANIAPVLFAAGVTSTTLVSAVSDPGTFVKQINNGVSLAVPFEFSPEQGVLLGVPLFLGLRQIKKRSAAKKQANI